MDWHISAASYQLRNEGMHIQGGDRSNYGYLYICMYIYTFSFQTPEKSGLRSDNLGLWGDATITGYSIKKPGYSLKPLKSIIPYHQHGKYSESMGDGQIPGLPSAGPVWLQERPFLRRLWKMSGNPDPGRIVNHFPQAKSE